MDSPLMKRTRDLAAVGLLLVLAVQLIVAAISMAVDTTGLPGADDFALRAWDQQLEFVGVTNLLLPYTAVFLAVELGESRTDRARQVVRAALVLSLASLIGGTVALLGAIGAGELTGWTRALGTVYAVSGLVAQGLLQVFLRRLERAEGIA